MIIGSSSLDLLRELSRYYLDDSHHAFVLMIDSMAVIDEASDDHRIGEWNDDLQQAA